MKLADLAKQAPRFVGQTLGLLGGPKRVAAALDADSAQALTDALFYYAFALIVAFVLDTPFADTTLEYWTAAAVTVLFEVLVLIAMTVLLFASWRLVGGRGSLRAHLVPSLYFWGIGVLVWSLAAVVSKGIMSIRRPGSLQLYDEYVELLLSGSVAVESEKYRELVESDAMMQAMAAMLIGQLALILWFFLTWGAYRAVNAATKRRSAFAMILFLALGYGAASLLLAAQHALGINTF